MKAKQLINITKTVTEIMEADKQTRNSDSLLYLRVLQKVTAVTTGTECLVSPRSMSVDYFLKNMKDLGFPPFESVRRARQMVQSRRPDLRASERVEVGRMENEKEYRAFARSGVRSKSGSDFDAGRICSANSSRESNAHREVGI